MHALRLHGPRDARLDEVPEPQLSPGTVKLHVAWAGICGSDLRFYVNGPTSDEPHPLFGEPGPHTLGHEFAGTVTEVASDVTGVRVGDLVAIRPNVWDDSCPACARGDVHLCDNWGFIGINGRGGGFSDVVVAPREAVHVLPPGMAAESGALVESLAVAWHAVRRGGVRRGTTVLIVGAGPIGLAILLAAQAAGAKRIIVSEPSPYRAELATQLGADVIDPTTTDVADRTLQMTDAVGVDVSFDAAGFDDQTFAATIAGLRKGGSAVVVARTPDPVRFEVGSIFFTEKTVTGSFSYTDQDFAQVVEAIGEGRLDPSPLVSSRIALTDIVDRGLEHLLGDGRATEVKILVSPRSL